MVCASMCCSASLLVGSDWIFSDVAVERVGTGSLKHGVEPSLWNRVRVDENDRSEERALVFCCGKKNDCGKIYQ